VNWSQHALSYLDAHAIDPRVATAAEVTERGGALVYPYAPRHGATFERTRPLNGKRTYQPKDTPLVPWWPLGVPQEAKLALVCEGESDALAALTAVWSRNGDTDARRVLRRMHVHVAGRPRASSVSQKPDSDAGLS
jgi:hypothetical protein